MDGLSHIDSSGSARMVDVGDKRPTARSARARATLTMRPQTASLAASGDNPKGDVISTARLAGIQAAKRTWDLIPLAHNIALSFVDVSIEIDAGSGRVTIESEARTQDRTGVEMEALTACTVAALTVYDMVKAVEHGVRIEAVELTQKSGGRADWRLED